jgi:MFS family permease
VVGASLGSAGSALRELRGNLTLVRLLGAYGSFLIGEFGIWITLLVYAYDRYGTTGTTVVVLVQLVPGMGFSPFAGDLADRRSPAAVLRASYVAQACALGAMTATVALHGPAAVVFALGGCATLGMEPTRPAQGALLPSVVRTPTELTIANVLTGWLDGAASLAGPVVVGVAIALGGFVPAMAVTAAVNLLAAALLVGRLGLARRAEARPAEPETAGVLSGVRRTLALPATRLLLVYNGFYYLLIGALDVLCVVLAVSLLHLGQGAAGYLNAALGGGATVAGVVTLLLAGRRDLARVIAAALLVSAAALALIGALTTVAATVVLLVVVGLSGAVFQTMARVLLQRAAPADATGAAFAAVEAVMSIGLAAGALVVRAGVAVAGLRAALFAPALLGLLLVLVTGRRLRSVDTAATVPQVEIRLLRSLPIFAPLATPVLEGVARQLRRLRVPAGTAVVREGEPGDRYFAVADGRLSVTRRGELLRHLGRGSGFGEIALLAETPRTATVAAETDAVLYSLDKDAFIGVLTGHLQSHGAARALIASYEDDVAAVDPPTPAGDQSEDAAG